MERHPVVAVLLALTALVVLVPVAVHVARREFALRQGWPYLLVGIGMVGVAVGYGLLQQKPQGYVAAAGFVMALLGMLALQRKP